MIEENIYELKEALENEFNYQQEEKDNRIVDFFYHALDHKYDRHKISCVGINFQPITENVKYVAKTIDKLYRLALDIKQSVKDDPNYDMSFNDIQDRVFSLAKRHCSINDIKKSVYDYINTNYENQIRIKKQRYEEKIKIKREYVINNAIRTFYSSANRNEYVKANNLASFDWVKNTITNHINHGKSLQEAINSINHELNVKIRKTRIYKVIGITTAILLSLLLIFGKVLICHLIDTSSVAKQMYGTNNYRPKQFVSTNKETEKTMKCVKINSAYTMSMNKFGDTKEQRDALAKDIALSKQPKKEIKEEPKPVEEVTQIEAKTVTDTPTVIDPRTDYTSYSYNDDHYRFENKTKQLSANEEKLIH